MSRSQSAPLQLAFSLLLCLIATTACTPIFPSPDAPFPPLFNSDIRGVVRCQDTIAKSGRKFVSTQFESVEDCAMLILELRLLYENDAISQEEYEKQLDKIRDRCDKGFNRVARFSTRFVDDVIDACDPYADLILEDYDSLRFQLLEDATDDTVDAGSVPLLAGSLCGIKALVVNLLIVAQIPRAPELISYLGPGYVVVTDPDDDYDTGYINLEIDPRCRTFEGET